ncbi:MAG: RNA polymerase sigma factor [Muribaculaceae bacterium]|jgi:RNA polymerase sigma-70 factor, ECF subfamily|nr:RNA polymerase sigma factor [Muribaculaceae bacterium]
MDSESFKTRLLPFYKKLYRIAVRIVGDEAEDMVQEAYMKLWDKRKELENIDNDEAFCIQVLKNVCLDHLRSRHEAEKVSAEEVEIESETSTANKVESHDDLMKVLEIMEHLPPKQREALRLRSIADCSMEEIEKAMGLSNINIRTLLSRARKQLREQITVTYN